MSDSAAAEKARPKHPRSPTMEGGAYKRPEVGHEWPAPAAPAESWQGPTKLRYFRIGPVIRTDEGNKIGFQLMEYLRYVAILQLA